MDKVEGIKASDLLKLMQVVEKATGLWNALERLTPEMLVPEEFSELGAALRALGLAEVKP